MNNAVLGLGTNKGNRIENLRLAINHISHLPNTNVINLSNIYEAKQVEYQDQDDFLYINIMIETHLSPTALLGACFGIEGCMGQFSNITNGSKIIDIDLLLYSSVRMDTFELTLPHPKMLERAFVLKPLLDLYPAGRAPGLFFLPKLNELGTDGLRLYDEKISLK